MRGTDDTCVSFLTLLRFIPACAGNRRVQRVPRSTRAVHPRVCGEQRRRNWQSRQKSGSSPRVRGTGAHAISSLSNTRFIPACAGNRKTFFASCKAMAVHPRVCGEQLQFGLIPRLLGGSSPRVRGTGPARRIPVPVTRFIPACAGNRTLMPWPYWRRTVHPRVCGEQKPDTNQEEKTDGSSPRVRGTASGHMMWTLENRFIPACAGNRSFLEKAFPLQPVHPRVCGEQVCRFNSDVIQDGSSPRVRGTVSLVPLARMMDRFIPACAGNSPQ